MTTEEREIVQAVLVERRKGDRRAPKNVDRPGQDGTGGSDLDNPVSPDHSTEVLDPQYAASLTDPRRI